MAELNALLIARALIRTATGVPVCPGCLYPDMTCDEDESALCLGCRNGVSFEGPETVH